MTELQTIAELQEIYDSLPKVECKRLCQEYCGPLTIPRIEYVQIEKTGAIFALGDMSILELNPKWEWMGKKKIVCTVPNEFNRCTMLYPSGKCRVYSVRPLICRLFGVVDSPYLRCPHGCIPERWLSDKDVRGLFERVLRIQYGTP